MQCPDVMRPNADRLRELRGNQGLRDVASAAGIDWRTLASYELGEGTEKFQYNQLNRLAYFYDVPFMSLLESASLPTPTPPALPAPAEAEAVAG